jgi:hypothetical protein
LEVDLTKPPDLRHWHATFRLESLIVQVLTRGIRNNHSADNAAKILFADRPNGTGSGWIAEYLDGMPGIRVDKQTLISLTEQEGDR